PYARALAGPGHAGSPRGSRAARAPGPRGFRGARAARERPVAAVGADLHARRAVRDRRGRGVDQPHRLYRRGWVRDRVRCDRGRTGRRPALRRARGEARRARRAGFAQARGGPAALRPRPLPRDRPRHCRARLVDSQAPPRAGRLSRPRPHRRAACRKPRTPPRRPVARRSPACPRRRAGPEWRDRGRPSHFGRILPHARPPDRHGIRGQRARRNRNTARSRGPRPPPRSRGRPTAVRPPPLPPPRRPPMTRYFTEEHEWIEVDGDTATVGITDHAQSQLGDIVFVEVPKAGAVLAKGKEAAVVESVKAASDVYAPVSGTVTEGNTAIEDDPALVNSAAEGEGWFFRLTLSDPTELDGLMDEAAYRDFAAAQA